MSYRGAEGRSPVGRGVAFFAVTAFLFTGACNADRTLTSDGSLTVEPSISDATIGAAESATITYRIRNVGRTRRTVHVGCDISRLQIYNERGASVFSGDRAVICSLIAVPPDTLDPGEELTRTFTVSGAAASSFIKLPPARYTATMEFFVGTLPRRRFYALRSHGPSFEVTP